MLILDRKYETKECLKVKLQARQSGRKGVNKMEYSRVSMGKRICSLRAAKDMTQEQLAEVLCVSPAAVSKWERNMEVPNVEMLWMLADFFGCTIDELVGRWVCDNFFSNFSLSDSDTDRLDRR